MLFLETLEKRCLLAAGMVELGPSDNIALDQPRVAIEFGVDTDPGPAEVWESIGPGLFNTFLLDTGASSVLAMATAIAEMEQSRLGYDVQGALLETGVAGDHLLDVSIPYRFDYAGSSGIRHTMLDTRIMSDATKDFSAFGPWGLAGMPLMVNQVTEMDFTGWSGGGVDLDTIYMKTEFRDDVPASNGHRYTIPLDNRIAFDPLDQMVYGQPPVWGDVPFLSVVAEHRGIAKEGNFLFDTGAQISLISKQLAIDIGLDSNGDGVLDQYDDNFVIDQVVGGVGGQISVPVFGFDEIHVMTESGVELVWTNLEWLVLDISIPGQDVTLDGVFGSDLLTSGWFHAFFSPGQPDGYINQIYMDFREMETNGTGKIHLDLNPDLDNVILPGPGIIVRQSFRTTDVGEGGETDSYDIVLTGQPTGNVVVTVEDPVGQVNPVNSVDGTNQLVFTPENWETVQTVLVTAVDDLAAEGNHTTEIKHTVTSSDPGYDGRTVPNVRVRITDDDLNLLKITSDQAGLNPINSMAVAEGGGKVFYWVSLSEQPPSEYWVVMEDGTAQAIAEKADNPQPLFENILEFNAGNWNIPQRVSLRAIDDTIQEGDHLTKIVHTVLDVVQFTNPVVGATPLIANITDNDLAVVKITESDNSTDIDEAGGTDSYEISLNMTPSAAVQITLQADDQTRISIDGGLTFAESQVLTFTDAGPKTVVVQAIDDAVAEETHFGQISHTVTGTTADFRFPSWLSIPTVQATISDNDVAGLTITTAAPDALIIAGTSSAPSNTIEVTEQGDTKSYWIALKSQPRGEVTVVLRGEQSQLKAWDANQTENDFLVFNSTNWDTPQRVIASAVDDGAVEGIHQGVLNHHTFSADANYHGQLGIPVTIIDNDWAEFGDAPSPYPTTVRDGGAYHLAIGPRLGKNRDAELDGAPSIGANADDGSNPLINDEDGVQFGGIQAGASLAAVNVLLENATSAKVDAWIDFDRDGIWEANEQILDSVVVDQAIQTLNYQLPEGLTEGDTYARVRLSSEGNLKPTGPAADGEVEDYWVHIVTPPTVESVVINGGAAQRSSINEITVTFDRTVDVHQISSDPFLVTNTDTSEVVNEVTNISVQDGKTVVQISFASGPSVTNSGSLADGRYQLIIDASLIGYYGVPLDGDRNGVAGDNHRFGAEAADAFYRKYGDLNANGVVDLLDFAAFRRAYGGSAGSQTYVDALDADGDNTIGLFDFAEFRRHYGL